MRNIDKLKELLKNKATEIRTNKAKLKIGNTPNKSVIQSTLHYMRVDYRHHHIAYCELKGKIREQIEKPNGNNEANESFIQKIKEQYAWTTEEILAYEERKAKTI